MDIWPAIAAAGLLFLGFSLAVIAKRRFDLASDTLFLSLFFAPIAAYLIFSRQLSDFSGFGFELKFLAASREPVGAAIAEAQIEPLRVAETGSLDAQVLLSIGSPVAFLKAEAPRDDGSAATVKRQLAKHIYDSMLTGTFELLVILDTNNHVLGYFPRHFFLDLLRIQHELFVVSDTLARFHPEPGRLDYLIRQTEFNVIFDNPAVRADREGVKHVVSERTSNIDALRLMAKERLDAVVVVDDRGRYKGILRKDDVIARVLIGSFERSQDGPRPGT